MLYPKDRRVRVERTPDQLVIVYDWSSKGGWWAVGFGIAALIAMTLTIILDNPNPRPIYIVDCFSTASLGLVFGVLPISIGYLVAQGETIIIADGVEVSTRHKPYGGAPSKLHSHGAIQFYVTRSATSGHSRISMIDRDGYDRLVSRNFANSLVAHQIRHELQDFYNLEDREIYGQTTDPNHPGLRPS